MQKRRFQSLTLVTGLTLKLLTIAAVLVVVGTFNGTLEWDIFGPDLEAILWGVFGSCLSLAGIGVAMTLVLGIRNLVRSFSWFEERTASRPIRPDRTPKYYRKVVAAIFGALALLILSLSAANHQILKHRSAVFKRLAAERSETVIPRLEKVVEDAKTKDINLMIEIDRTLSALTSLSLVNDAYVYREDLNDATILRHYSPRNWTHRPDHETSRRFHRSVIIRERERMIKACLSGDPDSLDILNEAYLWEWYTLVRDSNNQTIGLIRMIGNPRENYREYPLGS